MSDNKTTELFLQELQSSGNSLGIKELVFLCLNKWHWFAVSLVITVGVATCYILCTSPVYTRSASLLIKEDSKGQSVSSDVSSMFADMGLANSNTNVNNELIAIQSPAIIYEVVNRLNLDVDYKVKGMFHDETLYGSTLPVKVVFTPGWADNATLDFTLHLFPEGKVELDDLHTEDKSVKLPDTATGQMNDTITTPLGKIVVVPTLHYSAKQNYPAIHVSRSSLYAAADLCKGNFSAALQSEDATVIDLSYQDVSIQRAEDILNTIIAVYNENWVKDRNQITVSTSQFITERLGVIERELGDVDEDISSFKSEHLLPDVETASSLYMSQSQATSNQILALNTRLSMARYVRNHLTSSVNKNQLLPANSGIDSPGIEQQIAEYNTRQLQRNNLVSNSSEENPLVEDMDKQLSQMRNAIVVSIDNLIASINTQITGLQRDEKRTTAQIAANPDQSKYLQAVGRQQKVKESLYLFLLQKREENELSQAFTAYNTRLISPPTGNFIPVAPKRKNILAIALVLGLVIPFTVILLKENLNSTVRGRKDLEKLTIPFIGEIPLYIKKGEKNTPFGRILSKFTKKKHPTDRQTVVVESGKRDVMNEAFRVLRTNLEFMTGKNKSANVILLTSFNPDSGKTFLTMNIAVSLALKGNKILVIDGDLRKASTSAYVGSPKQGLSDYLSGGVDRVESLITVYPNYTNLHILPVGTIPPNPTELLYADRFNQLISEMRSRYDYVFIDCPPIDIMADTQIIEQYADRTIFVVRAGLLERSMLPELERIYKQKKYKNMTLILNGTEAGSNRYGYKYGYKYGYHYGYGSKNYYNN